MTTLRPGVTSIILVNFRGAADTIEAISYLEGLDYPSDLMEIIVVENASGDTSSARIRAAAPEVIIIDSKTNSGFAGGCNQGVAASSGEFVAFLNNDARPAEGWISEALAKFAESPSIGAVASKVLDWEGNLVDYIGSAMTWYGMGYKPFTAEAIPKIEPDTGDVLFGTGSAMFIRRTVFDLLEGFDERYFMFFEDVDLGWRLNLLGWRFAYQPTSIAYHKHHASMEDFGSYKETYLLERNALFTLYKNASADTLREALPAAMALSVRRAVTRGQVDSSSFDLRIPGGDSEPAIEISKQTISAVFALDQFVEALPGLRISRDRIQETRSVSDNRIWRLFGGADAPVYQHENYLRGYENIVTAFDVADAPLATKVLVITGDPLGKKMAGPAIRAWNIAEVLSRGNDVKLLSLSGLEEMDAPFDLLQVNPGDDVAFNPLEKWADVIIFQGHAMALFETLRLTKKIVVVDIYDPLHLEQLEQGRELPADQWDAQVRDANDVLNEQMRRGDFFLTASERQRMFWLGQLASLGRINPANYAGDPDLNGLVGIVPFGLSPFPPDHKRNVLREVIPGIGDSDKILLWAGGLYNWFDPASLIRAVAKLSLRRSNVRLFFQGTKHPHPGVPEMKIVAESRSLAKELGVLDTAVFFNPSWVDYEERQNYLTEADAGVSTHFSHIETTFSFRTRILDYLWAGLPMVVTAGDHFAEVIASENLGIVVDPGNVEDLANALERVLFDKEFVLSAKANIDRVRETYVWDNVLEPLVAFVSEARHARDNGRFASDRKDLSSRPRQRVKPSGLRNDLRLVRHYLGNGGVRVMFRRVGSRIRKRLDRK